MAQEPLRSRLAFIDIARGLAVVLMIQTHAYDAWLRPELRATEFFRYSQLIGGLPGAFFLFLMGLSMALGSRQSMRHGLVRAALLLVVAFVFRASLLAGAEHPDPNALFRVDILNCLAVSMALLSPIALLPARGSRVFVAIGVGAWFAMATPFVWDGGLVAGLPERIAGYLTGRVPNTTFPVFPWAAYAFAGHAMGSLIGAGREGSLSRMMNGLGLGGLAMVPLSFAFDRLDTFGPKYDYWWTSPNFVLIKTGVLVMLVWLCYQFERLLPRFAARLHPLAAALAQMGRTSLFIYWVHVDLVYGSRALPGLWRSCEIGEASRNLLLLTLAMLALSYGWSWLKKKGRQLPVFQPEAGPA